MAKYLIKKIGEVLLTLCIILLIIFLIFECIPGNPARIMLGMNADNDQVEQLEEKLGVNESLPIKIKNYLSDVFRGDFGYSYSFSENVSTLIKAAFPYTMILALYAFLFIIVLSVPLAFLSSGKSGSRLDHLLRLFAQIALSIPPFFMAIILMLLFKTSQLALGAGQGAASDFSLGRFWMPALAIALSRLAMPLEFLRDAIVEQKKAFYIKTAIGKGASSGRILFLHVLRNSLVPFVTVLGLILAEVFSGSIIIEQVFLIPGLGRLLVTAVERRDFRLTQGIILLIALIVVLVNFVVDLLNQLIDPRIRSRQKNSAHSSWRRGWLKASKSD